jgi:Probable transposase
MLYRTNGCVRVVWNRTLAARSARQATEGLSTSYRQTDAALTAMKRKSGFEWLGEVSTAGAAADPATSARGVLCVLRQACAAPPVQVPPGQAVRDIHPVGVSLAGRETDPRQDQDPSANRVVVAALDPALDPSTVTVSRDRPGRWFVVLHVEVPEPDPMPATGQSVGVDLGLKDFLVLSNEDRIPHPKHMDRRERRLKRYQRILARKSAGRRTGPWPRLPASTLKSATPDATSCTRPAPTSCGFRRDRSRGPGSCEHGQEPAPVQGDQRFGIGAVRRPADVQGAAVRRHPGRGGPVLPEQQDVLGVWAPAAIFESGNTSVDVPGLRRPARPGHQR